MDKFLALLLELFSGIKKKIAEIWFENIFFLYKKLIN